MEIMDPISLPVAASLLICISCSIFYLSYMLKTRKTNNASSLQTPPGSTGLPFIGEALSIHFSGKKGAPERFVMDRIKKYSSKVFRTSLIGQDVVVLASAEGNKFLFSNENKLVKFWWPSHTERLFFADPTGDNIDTGDKSLKMNKFLSPYFKPDALRRYVPIMDAATKLHLQTHWEGKDVVTALPLLEDLTFSLDCRLFIGIEDEQVVKRLRKQLHLLEGAVTSLPINFPGTSFNRGLKARAMFEKEINALIRQWKSDLSEGRLSPSGLVLADVLREAFDEEEDAMNMSGFIMGSLLVALENTSSTLASIMMYMAQLPHVYNEILTEQREIARSKKPEEMLTWGDIQKMKYSWNVVSEVLRLHPPSPGTFREAISDFKFDGFFIPKGWKLHWNSYSTHRSSDYFENPDKFDPSRFEGNGPIPFSYVPFGGGPRMCPGREYAKIKILVFMHNVVTKFRWEKLLPDEKLISIPLVKPSQGLPIHLFTH